MCLVLPLRGEAADLVGEWTGMFHCLWKEGRTFFKYNDSAALLFISQSGDELHIAMEGRGYDGRLYLSQEDGDRGTIGAEACISDGNAGTGFDDVAQMRLKKSRDIYVLNGSLTTGGGLDGPGRCRFRFKQINTHDPHIPDCNAP